VHCEPFRCKGANLCDCFFDRFRRQAVPSERAESAKVRDRCRKFLWCPSAQRTLNDGIVYPEFRCEPVLIPAGRHYADTSKINSSSTGTPSGRLATPYTSRLGFLSFPKTSCSNSEAPSAIFGCSRTSPEVATNTPSRTIRVTL